MADSELRATDDVYVAGDVASYEDSTLGRRHRAEHWNHAEITGRLAGANMTGTKTKFWCVFSIDNVTSETYFMRSEDWDA